MNIKNEVLYRVYFLLFGLIIPVAGLLCYRTVQISFIDGDKWRAEGKRRYIKIRDVAAERGNILARDGSLLATSLPFFDIAFDPNSSGMSEEDFINNIDSLAYCIATYVDNTYTVGGLRNRLIEKRNEGARYVPIKKKATFSQHQLISTFPLFNQGQFKGGFIARPRFSRKLPFGILANRTVGSVRKTAKPVGLEGKFNNVLEGEKGKQLMVRVDEARDIWIPKDDLTAIEPKRGDDIVTTLDINLQDVTERALISGLNYHQAKAGTAIVMDVKTGAIRAIANVERLKNGEGWWETYNYAIGASTEPGSTFKLASIMALLEDKAVKLTDTININKGKVQFYEEEMVDSGRESFVTDSTSVHHAFEISSNVGIAQLVHQTYGETKRGAQFIKRLKQFRLNLPTGIEIEGEANPLIKDAYSAEQNWSGTTLPWMAIGYEVSLTPLQLLTFYNAVANDGMMMKPYLVSEIQRFGEPVQKFVPTVIDRSIASKSTIQQAQKLLKSVVENGTAYKLKTSKYSFAGKTGTAQRDYRKINNKNVAGSYQASFSGYFPAENPVYSCIVVIYDPTENGIYGGDVAGPVFREIADKAFATKIDLQKVVNASSKPAFNPKRLPSSTVGEETDLEKIFDNLNIPYAGNSPTDWAVFRAEEGVDSLKVLARRLPDNKVPSVVGMGLRDALYLLENRNLKVQIVGFGKVRLQSIKPGTTTRGQTIKLTLG